MATEMIELVGNIVSQHEIRRDAIHIAIIPMVAGDTLRPGEHVGLTPSGKKECVNWVDKKLGVVDPFLTSDVKKGEKFLLFLYPSTTTGLRHVWSHPDFS